VVERPVLELEPTTRDAYRWIRFQQLEHAIESSPCEASVRVQDQDVGGPTSSNCKVVRGREPSIRFGGYELDFGELRSHHLGRAVLRGIVNDPDMCSEVGRICAK